MWRSLFFFVLFATNLFGKQDLNISSQNIGTMQHIWDVLLTSGLLNEIAVSDIFEFEVGVSQREVSLSSEENHYKMRTLHSFIDFPINLRVGINLTLPTYTIKNFETDLFGFFLKVQFGRWISRWLEPVAVQYNQNTVSLGKSFRSTSRSVSFFYAYYYYFLGLYTGFVYSKNETTYKKNDALFREDRGRYYIRFGTNIKVYVFSIYAETTLIRELKNYSVGLSIRF